ncbi:MAG TPA: cupin domain-containing protein [Chthoniobacteraceae bacterium]|jgi:mannose-6-phosphate isomerase-like protein (cupin superfamily)|nr:cupin domain-containing protein [Chthoniobacteraceae bacterium]
MKNYTVAQLDAVKPTKCPCGTTRRAFAGEVGGPATVHLLKVEETARTHYHKTLTEIYIILEGEGVLELDGDRVPLRPMTTVMIKPGCRHRAVGNLTIINVPIPAFDPEDEWFD